MKTYCRRTGCVLRVSTFWWADGKKKMKKKINQAITYMELDEFRNRFIDELSGGQRQRAYIAMVIAQDTEFVLLDEPTNNLDIYHATNLMKIVRRLCDELDKNSYHGTP